MSPAWMTVQAITPAMSTFGPASFRTSCVRIRTRSSVCEIDLALSAVCGSSITTNEGRTVRPSRRLYCAPRIAPVMPAVAMTTPLEGAPGMYGSTMRDEPHSLSVCSPLKVCPAQSRPERSRRRIGWHASGKSSPRSTLLSRSVFTAFSSATAAASVAPTISMYFWCP